MKTPLLFAALVLSHAAFAGPAQPATPAAPMAPGKPVLATAEGERSGARLEVRELKRGANDTVMLKLEIFNDGTERFALSGYYLGDKDIHSDANGTGGITLVDATNKKKY